MRKKRAWRISLIWETPEKNTIFWLLLPVTDRSAMSGLIPQTVTSMFSSVPEKGHMTMFPAPTRGAKMRITWRLSFRKMAWRKMLLCGWSSGDEQNLLPTRKDIPMWDGMTTKLLARRSARKSKSTFWHKITGYGSLQISLWSLGRMERESYLIHLKTLAIPSIPLWNGSI